eukprot:scaffold5782_cov36-Phaeocystis_antarctica.AAC.2
MSEWRHYMDVDVVVRYMVPSVHGRQRGRSSRRGRSEKGCTVPSRGLLGLPPPRSGVVACHATEG